MLVSSFDYHLPAELIAQKPLPDRAASRLLHLDRTSSNFNDTWFRDFPEMLRPDDLLVLNNTRVFPARIFGRRIKSEGLIELLLTHQMTEDPNEWECMARPGRKIGVGDHLALGPNDELLAEVIARGEYGERRVRFAPVNNFFETLDKIGHVPLPPYIKREDAPEDRERYQTLYSREPGSVAAPTAGLHFSPEVFLRLKERGIQTAEITLHVGLGTFQPIRVETVEDHKLHRERYFISAHAADLINSAREARRRVIAVGTTSVRTLEYAASLTANGSVKAGSGEADIFIYPGYRFQIVGGMLTNFHLPQSTLLMLVCAFAGQDRVLEGLPPCRRAEISFLLLWRLHVCGVIFC